MFLLEDSEEAEDVHLAVEETGAVEVTEIVEGAVVVAQVDQEERVTGNARVRLIKELVVTSTLAGDNSVTDVKPPSLVVMMVGWVWMDPEAEVDLEAAVVTEE